MATFTDCWEQHASSLSAADRQSIRDRASQYEADGLPKQDALRRSVQWHHDEAQSQLASVHDQLRQQYPELSPEPAAATKPTEVATPKAAAPASPEKPPIQAGTGVSSERFGEQYGDLAPVANTGRSASELKATGQSRLGNFQKTGDVKNDPYSVLTNLRTGKVPVIQLADDVSLLRAEHQRLIENARQAEGTPEYGQKAQAALNMAQAIKEVAHGPASDMMRSFQEYDAPKYDNFTDFDQALRERMGRESNPAEKAQFERIVNDRVRTRDVATKETEIAQKQVQKYRGREKMSFDDAAKNIHDQITELVKDCVL